MQRAGAIGQGRGDHESLGMTVSEQVCKALLDGEAKHAVALGVQVMARGHAKVGDGFLLSALGCIYKERIDDVGLLRSHLLI